MSPKQIPLIGILICASATAQQFETKPSDAPYEKFRLLKAPTASSLVLHQGDRLAICGDSITEQKMYSRLIEDYLTVCVPQLSVTARQYGWSGERAPGFLARMTNDCLRFHPTVATTCYGMNDHEYRPYDPRVSQTYREKSLAIIDAFLANGVRVVEGSPGCIGKMPFWVKSATGTVEDLNLSLCDLRNVGIEIAEHEKVGFADVFWPMLKAGVNAQKQYGTNYAITGKDGVHPGWAGHTVMAYAFLKAFGLNGDIGTFTVDLKENTMKTSEGHVLISAKGGGFEITSSRFPFCACLENGQAAGAYPVCDKDDLARDDSIRSGMRFVPFDQDLNRLELVVKHATALRYKIAWGTDTRSFASDELNRGINLAAEFPHNPFAKAFAKVDGAIAAKQAFETRQIKEAFRSDEAKTNMEAVVESTERERKPLAAAIREAFVPVTHTIRITPE
jgi:lysophospholipase L1-like esterase